MGKKLESNGEGESGISDITRTACCDPQMTVSCPIRPLWMSKGAWKRYIATRVKFIAVMVPTAKAGRPEGMSKSTWATYLTKRAKFTNRMIPASDSIAIA
jgi:hypothetical protein